MMANGKIKLALLWPRDAAKWNASTPREHRLNRVFEELVALGVEPEAAPYADDIVHQVREKLLRAMAFWSGSIPLSRAAIASAGRFVA